MIETENGQVIYIFQELPSFVYNIQVSVNKQSHTGIYCATYSVLSYIFLPE